MRDADRTVPGVGVSGESRDAHLPKRPMLPLMFMPALSLFAGILLSESWCWTYWCTRAFPLKEASAILCIAAVTLVVALSTRIGCKHIPRISRLSVGIILLSSFLMAGVVLGCVSYLGFHRDIERADAVVNEVRVRIVGDPKTTVGGAWSLAEMEIDGGGTLPIRVFWSARDDVPALGEICTLHGSFSPLKTTQAQRYLHEQRIGGSFTVTRIVDTRDRADLFADIGYLRMRCVEWIGESTQNAGTEATALLDGVILGYRCNLTGTWLQRDYSAAGLAHILAVSGTHLAVFSALIVVMLDALRIKRAMRTALTISLVIVYVIMTGLQPSAIRAGLMTAIVLLVWLSGRRKHALSALVDVALVMVAIEPSIAFSTGFRLSVCSCIGIIVFAPLATCWLMTIGGGDGRRRLAETLLAPCGVTLTAQAVTAPITVPLFSQLSLVAPLANLIVVPIVSMLLSLGLIALLARALIPPLGCALLAILGYSAAGCNALVSMLVQLPSACLPFTMDEGLAFLLSAAAAITLYLFWPLPTARRLARMGDGVREFVETGHRLPRIIVAYPRAAGICACLLGILAVLSVLYGFSTDASSLTVMDVGQGDALLVRDGGHSVLIDTGPSDSALLAALARNGVASLDAVVLTHFDSDHCAALEALRGTVRVDRVLVSEGSIDFASADESAGEVMRTAEALVGGSGGIAEIGRGDTVIVGAHVSLEVLWPAEITAEGGNESSIILLCGYDGDEDGKDDATALLTGDAEAPTLEEALEGTGIGAVDILKVAHHGSRSSLADDALDRLRVGIACISVGADNRYGHPKEDTLCALDAHRIATYRTDEDGDIAVTFDLRSYTVSCESSLGP